MAQIIDGRALAAKFRGEIAAKVQSFTRRAGFPPGLAVVLVGEDPASQIYVRSKEKACREVGFYSKVHCLPQETTQSELLELVESLNTDPRIHGILVQLPVPDQIDSKAVINSIDPAKDVDGFHPVNMGRLVTGQPGLVPCTPRGIMELLKSTGIEIAGKNALVIGRSNIVGKPVAALLLAANATVTVAHSKTVGLPALARSADILVVAVGRKELVKGDWIKPGAVVIDVGMNRVEGKLYGDVAFQEAAQKAAFITPVPGGVGPMTIAMLLANTLDAAEAIIRG
ncbi:MAG: bifunctional methylenetetrahydrofolate dehydrogenase/methenyltetrahydrofolate cyclohydrolase FolD [Firmicutes bacterium]|nr:bifunctional methylenetetrahydrofolate dehydrogenase/methenyltetrahydrofolate cyclohydrolase FolD [Bacillota bacterium]